LTTDLSTWKRCLRLWRGGRRTSLTSSHLTPSSSRSWSTWSRRNWRSERLCRTQTPTPTPTPLCRQACPTDTAIACLCIPLFDLPAGCWCWNISYLFVYSTYCCLLQCWPCSVEIRVNWDLVWCDIGSGFVPLFCCGNVVVQIFIYYDTRPYLSLTQLICTNILYLWSIL